MTSSKLLEDHFFAKIGLFKHDFDNQCTHRDFSGHEDYQILLDSLRNIVAEILPVMERGARHKIGLAPTAMAFSERLANKTVMICARCFYLHSSKQGMIKVS